MHLVIHYTNTLWSNNDNNQTNKKFRTVFGRFDKNEKPIMTFEYEKSTPFGKSMSNDKILTDYEYVQDFLRESGYTEY